MKNQLITLIFGIIFLSQTGVNYAQIKVVETERSDSTSYANSTYQDSVYIIYKGENNKSSITLTADFDGIDSLNFDWYRYQASSKSFVVLQSFDTVKNCTITYDNPSHNMNTYEGGYRVNIHNQQKGIDTTFTVWVWYQDFFINSISIYNSTCKALELIADTSFQDEFVYYDLSLTQHAPLKIENKAELIWTTDEEGKEDVKYYGSSPRFPAPVKATAYMLKASDDYGFTRERSQTVDETKFDSKGYPQLRAVLPEFSGIHGLEVGDNKPSTSSETPVKVEAPYGVWFENLSENAELFEWLFYNHEDWIFNPADTLLVDPITYFEPSDSIFYKYPRKSDASNIGYDVKLIVSGPEYNSNNDRCIDSVVKNNFVIVDTTQFPSAYTEMPNVFTPNALNNNYFYFVSKPDDDEKPIKSIQYFSIKIYNRWGNKVYEYEDDDGSWFESGKSKPGWDGTTRVGTKAKPGVYYYTILAKGWDGRDFEVGGFVHIFY